MAASGLLKPGTLTFTGNVARNWQVWKKEFDIFMEATDGISTTPSRQKAMFLNLIGREGRDVAENFKYPESTEITVEVLSQLFTSYCNPRKNTMYMRYKLWNTHKTEGETVDQFATRLLHLAKDGGYGDQLSNMVRDRIVFGIGDELLRERILEKDDIPLDSVLDIVRANETTKEQMRAMRANVETHHVMRHEANKFKRKNIKTKSFSECDRCGKQHDKNKCPATGKSCNVCFKIGHFALKCRLKLAQKRYATSKGPNANYDKRYGRNVHNVDDNYDYAADLNIDNLFVGHISIETVDCNKISKSWYQNVNILGTEFSMKLDSGAGVNILNFADYMKIRDKVKLYETKLTLEVYGGRKLKPVGATRLKTLIDNTEYMLPYVVAEVESPSILGLPSCSQIGLINRGIGDNKVQVHDVHEPLDIGKAKDLILQQYRDVFNGIGCYGEEIHLVVDPNVSPVVHPPRRVAISLNKPLREALDKLEAEGIIKKVDQPTEWVNSLLIKRKKDGSLRLCIDPRNLNQALKREHYRIPTADDIYTKMQGMKYFTVIDQKQGFWNLKLDEPSSALCTFNSPFGRYRFCRLPFGLSVAPEIFQKKNDKEFAHLQGVGVSTDDFIIGGRTEEECIGNLRTVLEKARSTNTKFNLDKLQFCSSRVKYLGGIVTGDGLELDPEKIEAVKELTAPPDKAGLKSILGFLNYMMPFLPNLAKLTAPLRALNKKNVEFQWDRTHDECLEVIKNTLVEHQRRQHFDPAKQIVIQVDASGHGLGGCLMQDGKPIAYTSRALLDHEERYPQIEKEFLAITNSCQKFHYYIYGHPVVIQTDHKPLVSVMAKPFDKISPRLQRFVLSCQKYNICLTYKPGKDMLIADLLSRNHGKANPNETPRADHWEIVHQVTVRKLPKLSQYWTLKILKAYEGDAETDAIMQMMSEKWVRTKNQMPTLARKYWHNRKNIKLEQGLITVNNKLFIPIPLRPLIVQLLHESHQGIEKTRLRARMIVYWPGVNGEIEDTVRRCPACQQYRPNQPSESLRPHEIPERPWQKVATDIFEVEGNSYLLVVDYFSKYPEVIKLPDKTASSAIDACKSIFARHGIPDQIISDNMPFGSCEFRLFCDRWYINLITSSPEYPQSNGMSERFVRTVKGKFKKALQAGTDLQLTLLEYRTTPLTGMKYSPAQLSMNRVLKTKLPTLERNLTPSYNRNARSMLLALQHQQKEYFNRNTHDLPELQPGQSGRIRMGKIWKPAQILNKTSEPRSYTVLNENGTIVRRNRWQFIPTKETFKMRGTNNQIPTNLGVPIDSAQRKIKCDNTPSIVKLTNSPSNHNSQDMGQKDDSSGQVTKMPVHTEYTTKSGKNCKKPS